MFGATISTMTKKTKHISALHKVDGVKAPETTDSTSIQKIKLSRNKLPSLNEFVKHILKGDISY